jgi:lipopolysaccharide/colanic/teichoic acid biosynthesis glycosyltransferase
MTVETEINGKKLNHDQRITKVGKFIRSTSLDELPQIINILKGDMSFIGPRPWITEYYNSFNTEQKRRTEVLPGLSGLAQVKGRNGLTIFDKIKYDLEYVNNISLKYDIKIIFLTIYTVLKKEQAEIIQESIEEEIKALKEQKRG